MRIKKSVVYYLFIVLLLLVILDVGFTIFNYFHSNTQAAVIPSLSPSPTPKVLANPDPKQANCPKGFYYYENSTYSLCYPDGIVPYLDTGIIDQYSASGGYVKDAVRFPDQLGNAEIAIIPSFEAARGVTDTSCETRESTFISGSKALKLTEREKSQNGCRAIQSITTFVYASDHPHFRMYYHVFGGGYLRYLNEYSTMERTLQIK